MATIAGAELFFQLMPDGSAFQHAGGSAAILAGWGTLVGYSLGQLFGRARDSSAAIFAFSLLTGLSLSTVSISSTPSQTAALIGLVGGGLQGGILTLFSRWAPRARSVLGVSAEAVDQGIEFGHQLGLGGRDRFELNLHMSLETGVDELKLEATDRPGVLRMVFYLKPEGKRPDPERWRSIAQDLVSRLPRVDALELDFRQAR